MKLIYFMVLFISASFAHADPFLKGDPVVGKQMVEKNCITCHASLSGNNGDDSAIYTRMDRKVKTASGLLTKIRSCNTNLGLKWFEDEELHVASYLNKTYYHLEK